MTPFRVLILVSFLSLAVACNRETPAPATPSSPGEASGQASAPAPAAGPVRVGSMMPAWTAETLDGKQFDFAEMKGQVVLLNIWATWCGPCRYEIPELVKLHAEWAPQGFAVLGASIDGGATVDDVAPMVRNYEINYPVVIDEDATIADLFETSVIPTSALIDREGKVVWTRIGTVHADDAEMVAAIRSALGSQAAPQTGS